MYSTEYRDSYWCYSNPLSIETDKYEKVVEEQITETKPLKQKEHPEPPERKEQRKRKIRTQKKKTESLLSSSTVKLKTQPRAYVHLPGSYKLPENIQALL